MSSVREQILVYVLGKLDAARADLGWATTIRNPREPLGDDQLNAIVLIDGGEEQPQGLTGHVDDEALSFSVGWLVREAGGDKAEKLLDAGYVAIRDALIDPTDIQLGALAIDIAKGATTEPVIGRGEKGARILGGMSMDFTVRYLSIEGDASTPAP